MDNQNDGWGSSLILILGMALCCGGPLLVIGLAAVGSPVVIVLAAAAVAGVGAIVALRRRAVA